MCHTHELRISEECQQLLVQAATEIVTGFLASPEPKWTTVGLDPTPVPIEVDCPSLAGNDLDLLDPTSRNNGPAFLQLLNVAIAGYIAHMPGKRTLRSIKVEQIGASSGVCCGKATVRDSSMDWSRAPSFASQKA